MTAHRIATGSRLTQIKLADPAPVSPNPDIAKDNSEAPSQHDVDTAGYLDSVDGFAIDALIDLIQGRLEEEENPEGWNDGGAGATAVAYDYRSRLFH